MSRAAITVVLPVLNGMPHIHAALESILLQTFTDFKVIAIDDGSTDGTGEYLDSIRDERLTVIHQSHAGLGAVLNLGIDLCDTEFLARMDADDISLPSRFEQQVACLKRDPAIIAVGSPLKFLVHDKVQTGVPYPTAHDDIIRDLIASSSSFAHPTLLMRTAAAQATRYRIVGAGEDLDFCLRLAEYGKLANLAEAQYLYRLHEGSVSMTKRGELECGYSYARLTAMERQAGSPETPLPVFVQEWKRRSIGKRIRTRLVSASLVRYRRARLAWAEKLYCRAAVHTLVSAALQPLRAAKVGVRKLGSEMRLRHLRESIRTNALLLDALDSPGFAHTPGTRNDVKLIE
jgi:glycosyltransferase involved in cell wall biosynthesis